MRVLSENFSYIKLLDLLVLLELRVLFEGKFYMRKYGIQY